MTDLLDLIIGWIVDAIKGGKLTPEQRTKLVAACSALPVPGPAEGALAYGNAQLPHAVDMVLKAIEADGLPEKVRDQLLDALLIIRPSVGLYRETGPGPGEVLQ